MYDDAEDGDDFIMMDEEDQLASSLDYDAASSYTISVPRIARHTNEYLSKEGEGSIGYTIAELHEMEVITPEFDDVLRGRLFQVFKGFDVIVDHVEAKKQKKKTTKGTSEINGGNNDE